MRVLLYVLLLLGAAQSPEVNEHDEDSCPSSTVILPGPTVRVPVVDGAGLIVVVVFKKTIELYNGSVTNIENKLEAGFPISHSCYKTTKSVEKTDILACENDRIVIHSIGVYDDQIYSGMWNVKLVWFDHAHRKCSNSQDIQIMVIGLRMYYQADILDNKFLMVTSDTNSSTSIVTDPPLALCTDQKVTEIIQKCDSCSQDQVLRNQTVIIVLIIVFGTLILVGLALILWKQRANNMKPDPNLKNTNGKSESPIKEQQPLMKDTDEDHAAIEMDNVSPQFNTSNNTDPHHSSIQSQ